MPGVSDGRVSLTLDYLYEDRSWSQIQTTFFNVFISICGVKKAGGKDPKEQSAIEENMFGTQSF